MLTGIKESQTLSQSSLLGESQDQAKAPTSNSGLSSMPLHRMNPTPALAPELPTASTELHLFIRSDQCHLDFSGQAG